LAFNILPVKAAGTIYIRADGSIDPPTASISTVDNITYTFTGDIYDSIVIERGDIVVDGEGYTLQGTNSSESIGTDVTGRSNVTVKNTNIKNYYYGILLYSSSSNSISGNNITNNGYGIYLDKSSNNSIAENSITANNYAGIRLYWSSYNNVSGNTINNLDGVWLSSSSNNTIFENVFTGCGLYVYDSYGNRVEGNTVNGKPLAYFEDVSDHTIGDAGQVVLVNCDNMRVENLNLSCASDGVQLWNTNNSIIANNNITANNGDGIGLSYSSNNTISGNNITADSPQLPWGLRLDNSSNNKIVNNAFTRSGFFAVFSYQNTVENNTVNGKPLVYLEGVSDHSVNDAGQVILLRCNNITVKDLDLLSTSAGVELFETNNTTISENNITENNLGIMLKSSSNNTITANNITRTISGISFEGSPNNTISRNDIAGVGLYLGSNTGINLRYSNHNSIYGNNITNNEDGIILEWNSDHNRVFENNITENVYGIGVFGSGDGLEYSQNTICHNNFVNNSIQVRTSYSMNVWDNGIEGNYWSNYTGVDLDRDGIGDTVHVLDSNNTDHYPLMSIFSSFDTPYDYQIDIVSNSSISHLSFSVVGPYQAMLTFNVSGDTGTQGFCRICIPKALINSSYVVKLNGELIAESQVRQLPCSNETYEYLYINYTHSEHTIEISGPTPIPEFPMFLFLALFMMVTLPAVIVYTSKKR
jgi:parallel beta-helix repeat protein